MQYLTTILRTLQARSDDDWVDRLNYYYTSGVLIVFAILVSAKQYVGYPIQCWVPAHFTEAMEQYTENFCWVQNTWWLSLEEHVPRSYEDRNSRQLIYYQWVPFILLLQAMLFYTPCLFWRFLNWHSGIDVSNLVQMACDARVMLELPMRDKTVATIARYLEDAIILHKNNNLTFRHKHKRVTIRSLKCIENTSCSLYGVYVTSVYLVVKMVYAINIILQFTLMSYFLGLRQPFFGIQLLMDLIEGNEWQHTGIFPRVTLCDFEVKIMGNLHRHTVQCVLMINMFNEKIFILMWFWFAVVLFLTLGSFLYWTVVNLNGTLRNNFIMKFLRLGEIRLGLRKVLSYDFVYDYLRQDGVFVLRLISSHAGNSILTDVLSQLWEGYVELRGEFEVHRRRNKVQVKLHSDSVSDITEEKEIRKVEQTDNHAEDALKKISECSAEGEPCERARRIMFSSDSTDQDAPASIDSRRSSSDCRVPETPTDQRPTAREALANRIDKEGQTGRYTTLLHASKDLKRHGLSKGARTSGKYEEKMERQLSKKGPSGKGRMF